MWLVGGLALFTGFASYIVALTDASDALKADGARVTATVLADQPERLRCGQVKVPLRFELDAVEHTENLAVDSCASNLTEGEQITLYVDPADPSNLVSDESDNENALAVLGAAVALVGGVALPACAVFRAGRLTLTRHSLRAGPWDEREARRVTISAAWGLGHSVVVLTDVDPPEMLELRWPATLDPSDETTTMVVRPARRWSVIANDPGARTIAVRVPRERVARKVLALISGQDEPVVGS